MNLTFTANGHAVTRSTRSGSSFGIALVLAFMSWCGPSAAAVHNGPLQGRQDQLEDAQPVGGIPNPYKVAVANGGDVRVVNRIEAVEQGSAAHALAAWFALGRTIPNGSFSNSYGSGLSIALGLEYSFTPTYSVEATLSRHRFDGKAGATDIDVTQLGVNAKWYLAPPAQSPRWFATAGVGSYSFDPGRMRAGASVGGGLQYVLEPRLSLEGRYGLHTISGNTPNTTFSTVTVALRYEF